MIAYRGLVSTPRVTKGWKPGTRIRAPARNRRLRITKVRINAPRRHRAPRAREPPSSTALGGKGAVTMATTTRRCTSSSSRLHRPLPAGTPKSTEGTQNSTAVDAMMFASREGARVSARGVLLSKCPTGPVTLSAARCSFAENALCSH